MVVVVIFVGVVLEALPKVADIGHILCELGPSWDSVDMVQGSLVPCPLAYRPAGEQSYNYRYRTADPSLLAVGDAEVVAEAGDSW